MDYKINLERFQTLFLEKYFEDVDKAKEITSNWQKLVEFQIEEGLPDRTPFMSRIIILSDGFSRRLGFGELYRDIYPENEIRDQLSEIEEKLESYL